MKTILQRSFIKLYAQKRHQRISSLSHLYTLQLRYALEAVYQFILSYRRLTKHYPFGKVRAMLYASLVVCKPTI